MKTTPQGATKARKRTVQISVHLHPEIHAALNFAKLTEGWDRMEDKLHAILCHEFERMDLLDQGPDLLLSQ